MSLLPTHVAGERYFADVHGQPLAFWRPALSALAARHGLPDGPWQRAALGRNVVFLSRETVVKLGLPCWPGDIAREAEALRFVAGKFPLQTPAVLACGAFDGWEYLVTARCPGTNLYELWRELAAPDRIALARQHGTLMAATHALPALARDVE